MNLLDRIFLSSSLKRDISYVVYCTCVDNGKRGNAHIRTHELNTNAHNNTSVGASTCLLWCPAPHTGTRLSTRKQEC